jgi:hypothetical protein
MNGTFVLMHLEEALVELQGTIKEIREDVDYERVEFQIAMSHIYHHLNTAWNSQDASDDRHLSCSEDDFKAWRKFPKESDLMLDWDD